MSAKKLTPREKLAAKCCRCGKRLLRGHRFDREKAAMACPGCANPTVPAPPLYREGAQVDIVEVRSGRKKWFELTVRDGAEGVFGTTIKTLGPVEGSTPIECFENFAKLLGISTAFMYAIPIVRKLGTRA